METWRRFINEGEVETELETTRNNVPAGDWIVKAMTRAAEEYVIEDRKFHSMYALDDSAADGPDGFKVYSILEPFRKGIVVTNDLAGLIAREVDEKTKVPKFAGSNEKNPVEMEVFRDWLHKNAKIEEVQKNKQIYAKQATGGESVPTFVEKSGTPKLMVFKAPWFQYEGETMPVKINDVLIWSEKEVYRIARAEFDQTYEFV